MIVTKKITKEYGGRRVVDRVSLRVEAGETYGFLGPNGSGKTTLIRMILGLTPPTSGEIYLFGKKIDCSSSEIKQRIGVVGETQHLYTDMTVYEYLKLFSDIFDVEQPSHRILELLERFGLNHLQHSRLGEFSHGMRQKVSLIRALLHDPDLLILDEPIVGLDPIGIKEVRDLIVEENRRGKTIFLSSHVLSEVESTAQRIGIILNGTLLTQSEIGLFLRSVSGSSIELELDKVSEQLITTLKGHPLIDRIEYSGNSLLLITGSKQDLRKEISELIMKHGIFILGMREHVSGLEDAFLTITEEKINLFTGENYAK